MTNYDAGWAKCRKCQVKRPTRDLVEVKVQVGDEVGVSEFQCNGMCPPLVDWIEGEAPHFWFGGEAWE